MFQIPTPEQWQGLFTIAEKIRTKKPWEKYPEELIFEFKPQEKDPFYITVHGYEEDVIGISLYPNQSDVQKYMNIIDQGDDVGFQTIIANQSCITVIYGEESHLSPGDVTAMEQAGFRPDGSPHSYIYFRKYQPGMSPWYIQSDDVILLTEALNAFDEATELFRNEVPDPSDFMIACGDKDGKKQVNVVDFDSSLRKEKEDAVKDDLYVARLKRLKKTARCLEIDICYLGNPVGSQLGPIPFFPRLCIIADSDEGYIADQCLFEETSQEEDTFFSFLSEYLQANGLPRLIRIKRENTGYLLHDLCKKLNIKVEEKKELPLIDDFLSMIGGFQPGE